MTVLKEGSARALIDKLGPGRQETDADCGTLGHASTLRDVLCRIYEDWINNYLTVAKLAEHHGLSEEHGRRLIAVARDVYNSKHPEA